MGWNRKRKLFWTVCRGDDDSHTFFLINFKHFTTLFGLESFWDLVFIWPLNRTFPTVCWRTWRRLSLLAVVICACLKTPQPYFTWQNRRRDIPAKSPSRIVFALAWYLPGSCNHVFVTTHFSVPYAPSIMEYAWTRLAQISAETKCFQNTFVVHPLRSCFMHMELPDKLLDCFLRSNKTQHQSKLFHLISATPLHYSHHTLYYNLTLPPPFLTLSLCLAVSFSFPFSLPTIKLIITPPCSCFTFIVHVV